MLLGYRDQLVRFNFAEVDFRLDGTRASGHCALLCITATLRTDPYESSACSVHLCNTAEARVAS